jgi:hypothetical protein
MDSLEGPPDQQCPAPFHDVSNDTMTAVSKLAEHFNKISTTPPRVPIHTCTPPRVPTAAEPPRVPIATTPPTVPLTTAPTELNQTREANIPIVSQEQMSMDPNTPIHTIYTPVPHHSHCTLPPTIILHHHQNDGTVMPGPFVLHTNDDVHHPPHHKQCTRVPPTELRTAVQADLEYIRIKLIRKINTMSRRSNKRNRRYIFYRTCTSAKTQNSHLRHICL